MAELKENKAIVVNPHKPIKVLLKTVSQQITCFLCKGYLIDATTIVECLHSFCHSCIIKRLKTTEYCPICELMINKKKPNIKRDATLQAIVYKLVPGLYEKELLRKRAFYKAHPKEAVLASPEQRGEDTEHLILSPNENIPLSLEYADVEEIEDQIELKRPKYLQCPAVFPVSYLKKFVLHKFGIDSNQFCVEIMYKVKTIVLPDHYTLMDVAYIYTWKKDASMKFFFRVRSKEVSSEELPEVPLRRSPSISDRNEKQTETIKIEQTEPIKTTATESLSTPTNISTTTETVDGFVKPKSPKSITPDRHSAGNPINDAIKSDLAKPSAEVQKSVNNEKSGKLEKLETKRITELRRSLSGNDKVEKKSVKDDEKNQKVKSVKKCKSDSSEKRFENIKLKIDLSRQNSVTIIKSSVNDLKMKFKTERDTKSESSETSADKPKDDVNSKKKPEIDVITLAKVSEKTDSNDSEVKYEIKSPKSSHCDNKEPVIKCESEIKVDLDIDEKKSEFLESFNLTPTKSLSPEKLAIIAEKKKIEKATANELLSKKEMFTKHSTKSVPWHQPYGQPSKANSKTSVATRISDILLQKQRNFAASSSASTKSPATILPKQNLTKVTSSQSTKNSNHSTESTVTLHSNKPNKDNPLKTTITKSASLSPKLLTDKSADENGNKSPQGPVKNTKPEPTVSKRKSKEPIKNIPKRRFSLSLDSPMKSKLSIDSLAKHLPMLPEQVKNMKLPVEPPMNRAKLPLEQPNLTKLPVEESIKNSKLPSMPSITEDHETSKVKKDVEIKPTNSTNRIWCVDPCALGGNNVNKTPSVPEKKTANGNTQKKETPSSLGKMLPPTSTSTPRKVTDNDNKGKVKINRMKPLAPGPRKLPTILPKPSPSSPASSMPQLTKMLKNPDTEIKQIPNGKDIKVYGPAMDMPKIPLGSTSPAYVPSFNTMHRNPSAGYLNYALMNSRNRTNELPLGMRSPAYSPASPIYSPNSPQYSPNYGIPTQQFKYMKSPAYIPNYPQTPNGASQGVNSLKTVTSSPKKSEKLNENNKRPHSNTPDGNSPPEKQAKVQSLLESCKINFPSSLSITLHEQNDSSMNNPLFNPKRNSPVNNYIEIVKLPEIPAKEEVKQNTQPKSETNKPPSVKPVTPKPPVAKSPSPKPQVNNNDKEKVLPDSSNTAKVTSEPKKSPETKAIPELNAMDKSVAALLKVRRDKETGYQGKFLESILEKKRNELAPPPPKMSKPNPESSSNGSSGSKKPATPPLTPKATKSTTKSQSKPTDPTKPSKPNSPKNSPPKQGKSDAALDLSAPVNLANKTSNNNNNKSQLDQPDMTALFADVMARASHTPNFMLPAFGQQMGLHMHQALWLENLARMRRAGHDKLNEALESFVKTINNKHSENS
ncbi:polycomb group protein Psc [Bradysia coprophila]|uniref:polycomb group protein Psc n=1 Tax=Bradysia coprophila TaxID=38358 RepID=UPI00187DCB9A|nr:polycomb group protein Psc [Bradysia coprophila]XP_037037833.1 polycomb group protein Psc [Bradysia coprophila]